MRKSFGRPVSLAARVNSGQKIITANVPPEFYKTCRKALRRARMKLPMPGKIQVDKGADIISS